MYENLKYGNDGEVFEWDGVLLKGNERTSVVTIASLNNKLF